jgi:DNA-binding transcriptional ArsR family regulator
MTPVHLALEEQARRAEDDALLVRAFRTAPAKPTAIAPRAAPFHADLDDEKTLTPILSETSSSEDATQVPQIEVDWPFGDYALSDPTRRFMVERLSRGSASVSELAEPLEISLAAVIQHLQVLEESGVVKSEKVGGRWANGTSTLFDAVYHDIVPEQRRGRRGEPGEGDELAHGQVRRRAQALIDG